MNSTLYQSPSKQLAANNMSRTKLKFKPHKTYRQGQEKQQPQFNDPLYEHLDNQVFNRQQHNFGPWVEMDRRSREQTSQRRTQIKAIANLPEIYQQRPNAVISSLDVPIQQHLEHSENVSLPALRRERSNRASSLQQLRGVSIQLNAPEAREEPHARKDFSLSRQPFFLRAQVSYRFGANSSQSLIKRSNVIYNYCLREEEEKILNSKLKTKAQKWYLKLQQVNKGKSKSESANFQLLKELKEYRINKLK